MAQRTRFECDQCGRSIEAWSDGNPYYLDQDGKKRYAYHPDHENLDRCIGNDVPHLCLACGAAVTVDNRDPRDSCPDCQVGPLVATYELEGQPCPYCDEGTFRQDPDHFAVS